METELNLTNLVVFQTNPKLLALRRHRVEFDVLKYQKYLDQMDLTAEQRQKFLEAIWTIIIAFVDLGYGIHPTQHPFACGNQEGEVFDASLFKLNNQCERLSVGGNRHA